MKNMINFIVVNVLIIIFLIAAIHIKIFFLPLTVFVFLNIYLIYRRSSDLVERTGNGIYNFERELDD